MAKLTEADLKELKAILAEIAELVRTSPACAAVMAVLVPTLGSVLAFLILGVISWLNL